MTRASNEPGRYGTETTATRPMVRDFSPSGGPPDVTFDSRTAYDFLISAEIGNGDESELLPEDRDWLKRSRAALDTATLGALDACFGEEAKGIFHGLAAMLVDDPSIIDSTGVVAALEAAGSDGIARLVIRDTANQAIPDDLVDRLLARDPAAEAEVQPLFDPPNAERLRGYLDRSAEEFGQTQAALSAWRGRFAEVEDRIGRFQARDLASRGADERIMEPEQLIERVTGGLRWIADGQQRRVILAPSYFSRPFNYVYAARDWRLFAYPIADEILETADGITPPASVVRLYRALGDPTRLRILKLLTDRDWYLTELATQLELSKPTMKHHLAQLRAAGLVTVIEEGSLTYYNLRRERLAEAGVELRRFVG
jgi:DNA-binding transcriptional ArsR family regulator